jgi:hypothetical protein
MDYDDMMSDADDARYDDLMEREHERGEHDRDAENSCWLCQQTEEGYES